MFSLFKNRLNELLCIIFPHRCYFCNNITRVENFLCTNCDAISEEKYIISEPHCSHCGAGKKHCNCGGKKMFYSNMFSPFYYNEPASSLVRQLKFHNKENKAKDMAKAMAEQISRNFPDLPFDLICYVPQTKNEMHSRGYNQTQLLANELGKLLNIKISDALIKLYDTQKQQSLSSTARSGNVHGVFNVKEPSEIYLQNILLIDDIKTTGATLNECAKMLRIYEANTVIAAVFALTHKEKQKKIN